MEALGDCPDFEKSEMAWQIWQIKALKVLQSEMGWEEDSKEVAAKKKEIEHNRKRLLQSAKAALTGGVARSKPRAEPLPKPLWFETPLEMVDAEQFLSGEDAWLAAA